MNSEKIGESCPLCAHESWLFHKDAIREYYRCVQCKLVFVPRKFHVAKEREKQEYDLHENSSSDKGYLKFLSRFSDPFVQRLRAPQRGLDFGCGPGPALAGLLELHGHTVDLYDPFYYKDKDVLNKRYDFITTTEVVEHFRDPAKEFKRLFEMLLPLGTLGIMTKMVQGDDAFTTWHYIRDVTHISFFSKETFNYLAGQFGATVDFVADDVIIMKKGS